MRRRPSGSGTLYRPSWKAKDGKRHKLRTWWMRYQDASGKRVSQDTGQEVKTEAEKVLRQRAAREDARRPAGPRAVTLAFEHLAEMLSADYRANSRKSEDRAGRSLKHLRAFFGAMPAEAITEDRITAYVAKRRDTAAAATVNRELAALRRALRLAHNAGRLHRMPVFHLLAEQNARKGFFEKDQVKAVLAKAPDWLRPVLETAYITGWRVNSELLTRQRRHLDLEAGWLRLEPGETKNGRGRMFPLTPRLRAVLRAQEKATRALEEKLGKVVPWLFHREGKPIRDFRGVWDRARREAGVPGRLIHDFRRTAVRNLERAGVSRPSAMAMVGHETESIYRRYAIVHEDDLREAAAKLAKLSL